MKSFQSASAKTKQSILLLLTMFCFCQNLIAQKKPNIIVIMADDIGVWNVSAYHRGMMGGRTPNIDRIANEGALFTDYYGQQSCTAGVRLSSLGKLHSEPGC